MVVFVVLWSTHRQSGVVSELCVGLYLVVVLLCFVSLRQLGS